ncbi:beta-galactoside-binding lectin-like [Pholidichthys leucotaenia]
MSFSVGQTMIINGVVNIDPKRFSVNIGDIDLGSGQGEIALHVDLRFDYNEEKNVLILNSYEGGKWGSEFRIKYFPFEGEKQFKIAIAFTPGEFLITCNDLTAIHFKNNVGKENYNTIDFKGDASISSVIIS